MASEAERIIGLYERHAEEWDKDRGRSLFEKAWLDRFLALLPQKASILDIGCGSAEPIARYLIEKGCEVTGIDSSPALIGMCKDRFPDQDWIVADMRTLSLDRRFDGILAWNSFFHLCPEDQRGMFPIFRRHAGTEGSPDVHERSCTRGGNRHVQRRTTLPREPGWSRVSLAPRPEWLRCRVARRRRPKLRSPHSLACTGRVDFRSALTPRLSMTKQIVDD